MLTLVFRVFVQISPVATLLTSPVVADLALLTRPFRRRHSVFNTRTRCRKEAGCMSKSFVIGFESQS
jgi:hypothetical protein